MKTTYLLILLTGSIFLSSTTNVQAQQWKDSLLNIVQGDVHDTVSVNALLEINKEYISKEQFDSALVYAKKAQTAVSSQDDYHKAQVDLTLAINNDYLGNFKEAIKYYQQALEVFTPDDYYTYYMTCMDGIAGVFMSLGSYGQTLDYCFRTLEMAETNNDDMRVAHCYKLIGMTYNLQKNYEKAHQYYIKSNQIYKSYNYDDGLIKNYINLGINFSEQGFYDEALKGFSEAMKFDAIHDNSLLLASCYSHIGETYQKMGQVDTALYYNKQAEQIFSGSGYKLGVTMTLISTGNILVEKGNHEKAITYFKRALFLAEEMNARNELRDIYQALARTYAVTGNYKQAYFYQKKFSVTRDSLFKIMLNRQTAELEILYQTEQREQKLERQTLQTNFLLLFLTLVIIVVVLLIFAYHNIRKTNNLLKYKKQVIQMKNEVLEQQKEEIQVQTEALEHTNHQLEKLSLVASRTKNAITIINAHLQVEWVNEEFTRLFGYTVNEFQDLRVESEKFKKHHWYISKAIEQCIRQREPVVYSHKNITADKGEIWLQTTLTPIVNDKNEITYFITVDTDITELKKAKEQIEIQRDEIETQRDRIVEQRKQTTSSLQYARRIQAALLPMRVFLDALFPNHFIINKPKDIVSGDFYWLTFKNSKRVFAVADCTGHGVPGALMSMLGVTLLKEIINYMEIIEANEILNSLRLKVIRALHQRGKAGEANDGMDIAVITMDYKEQELQFAGANIPIYIVKPPNNDNRSQVEVQKIKPDRMPISIHANDEIPFTNHKIKITEGDMVYITTDGFVDQFGGEKDKKFMSKQFQEMLENMYSLNMKQQGEMAERIFDQWKANQEQVDDVLVAGIKI